MTQTEQLKHYLSESKKARKELETLTEVTLIDDDIYIALNKYFHFTDDLHGIIQKNLSAETMVEILKNFKFKQIQKC